MRSTTLAGHATVPPLKNNHKFTLNTIDSDGRRSSADYGLTMFHDALSSGSHVCYLSADTRLPMMFEADCLRAIAELLRAPTSQLRQRTYNVQAMSFTPAELAAEIRRHVPHFKVSYRPDERQAIGE